MGTYPVRPYGLGSTGYAQTNISASCACEAARGPCALRPCPPARSHIEYSALFEFVTPVCIVRLILCRVLLLDSISCALNY